MTAGDVYLRCVITGFDAFDSADVNASEEAVGLLGDELFASVGVPVGVGHVKQVLATCCSDAWHSMEAEVRACPPNEDFAVVMSGLAGNRNRICLERFALNVRSYRVPDNRGHRWQEEYIDENAPDALRSSLPLFELAQHLNERGLMSDISNYAGSFVCNETYFRCLQKWRNDPRCRGIVFIHFPQPIDYVGVNKDATVPATVEELKSMSKASILEYARALAEVVKFIAVRSDTQKNLVAT